VISLNTVLPHSQINEATMGAGQQDSHLEASQGIPRLLLASTSLYLPGTFGATSGSTSRLQRTADVKSSGGGRQILVCSSQQTPPGRPNGNKSSSGSSGSSGNANFGSFFKPGAAKGFSYGIGSGAAAFVSGEKSAVTLMPPLQWILKAMCM
jgi:hypothetical protein